MEKKRDKKSCEGNGWEELSYISGMIQRRVHMWILYAIGSAFFAGITAIPDLQQELHDCAIFVHFRKVILIK